MTPWAIVRNSISHSNSPCHLPLSPTPTHPHITLLFSITPSFYFPPGQRICYYSGVTVYSIILTTRPTIHQSSHAESPSLRTLSLLYTRILNLFCKVRLCCLLSIRNTQRLPRPPHLSLLTLILPRVLLHSYRN